MTWTTTTDGRTIYRSRPLPGHPRSVVSLHETRDGSPGPFPDGGDGAPPGPFPDGGDGGCLVVWTRLIFPWGSEVRDSGYHVTTVDLAAAEAAWSMVERPEDVEAAWRLTVGGAWPPPRYDDLWFDAHGSDWRLPPIPEGSVPGCG